MRLIGDGTLEGTLQVKSAQSKLKSMSKLMNLGTTYRIFLPTMRTADGNTSVIVASVYGRKLDGNKLDKKYFVPIDEYEESDSGAVRDMSGLDSWARIARILHAAEKEQLKVKKEGELRAEADRMGTIIDQIALQQAYRQIDLEYDGDNTVNPPIYASCQPMVSGGVLPAATEVVMIPLTSDGKPEFAKAESASLDLNTKRLNQLKLLVGNRDYCNPDNGYLEVEYSYIGTSKQQAGMNASFQGVAESLSLAARYQDLWASAKDRILGMLPTNRETIAARNMSFSSSVTPAEVVALMKKYISEHRMLMTYIDMESDEVKKVAGTVLENKLADGLPNVQSRLIALVNEEHGGDDDTSLTYSDVQKVTQAATLADLEDMKHPEVLDDASGLESLE